MISKDEIIAVADETGLTPSVVEKDYVLGWLLAAVNANAALSGSWVFKGVGSATIYLLKYNVNYCTQK